jgi:hypothetical protein
MNGLALLEELWNTHVVRVEPIGRAFLYKDCLLDYEVTSPQAFAFKNVRCGERIATNRLESPPADEYSQGARSVRRAQSEMLNERIKIAIAVQQ